MSLFAPFGSGPLQDPRQDHERELWRHDEFTRVRGCAALQHLPFLVQERLKLKPKRKRDPLRPIRVRRDPPTLEEAVVAAQGLSDDIEQQVEIASGLMGIPQEEVRPVLASAPPSETARGFERSSRAMPQVVVLRRRAVR